jgi:hypothetical protein
MYLSLADSTFYSNLCTCNTRRAGTEAVSISPSQSLLNYSISNPEINKLAQWIKNKKKVSSEMKLRENKNFFDKKFTLARFPSQELRATPQEVPFKLNRHSEAQRYKLYIAMLWLIFRTKAFISCEQRQCSFKKTKKKKVKNVKTHTTFIFIIKQIFVYLFFFAMFSVTFAVELINVSPVFLRALSLSLSFCVLRASNNTTKRKKREIKIKEG